MAYATQTDMLARFDEREMIERTNKSNKNAASVNAAVMGVALDDASAWIDTFLLGRYEIPLATTPSILVSICCNRARANLYADAIYAEGELPEWKARVEADELLLRQVAEGKLQLGASTLNGASPLVANVTADRVFTRARLGAW